MRGAPAHRLGSRLIASQRGHPHATVPRHRPTPPSTVPWLATASPRPAEPRRREAVVHYEWRAPQNLPPIDGKRFAHSRTARSASCSRLGP